MTLLSFKENKKNLHNSKTWFRDGLYEQALNGFKTVLESSDDSLMYANIGYCYQRLEQYELAYQSFNQFIDQWPFKTHAWKAMAYCAYELKAYQKMERCALIAIKWDRDLKKEDDEYAWQQLTIAQFLLNKPKGCLNSAWHTLALNPTNSYVKYYEACALCHEETLDLDEATIALLDAVTLTPELWTDAQEEGHVDAILDRPEFKSLPDWFILTQAILDHNLTALKKYLLAYPNIPTQGKWTLLDFAQKQACRGARHFLMDYYDIAPPIEETDSDETDSDETDSDETDSEN
jgi:tetratricopeptide (TPR) repeat protein